MSLAYATPTSRAISENASIFAAKVLYKLLVPTPTDNHTDIKRYVYIDKFIPLSFIIDLYFSVYWTNILGFHKLNFCPTRCPYVIVLQVYLIKAILRILRLCER